MEVKEWKYLGRYIPFISNNDNTRKDAKYMFPAYGVHLGTKQHFRAMEWEELPGLTQRNWGSSQTGFLDTKLF